MMYPILNNLFSSFTAGILNLKGANKKHKKLFQKKKNFTAKPMDYTIKTTSIHFSYSS